ncbi:MAG: flagellar hook-length control protein FliK [Actinobacteria bacterium]|nr:flagellar hook-length control protein FliK [Actinomycetota bacterium]
MPAEKAPGGEWSGYLAPDVRMILGEASRGRAGMRRPERPETRRPTDGDPVAGKPGTSGPTASKAPFFGGRESPVPAENDGVNIPHDASESPPGPEKGGPRVAGLGFKPAMAAAPAEGAPGMPERSWIHAAGSGNPATDLPAWDRLVERVAGALRTVREGEVFRARLRLHPPQLGSLEVEAEWSGALKVSLQAQSPQALAVLREGLEHLRQLLLSQGLPLQDLQLSLKGDDRGRESGGRAAPALPPAREAVEEGAPRRGTRGWRLGTLDLWV